MSLPKLRNLGQYGVVTDLDPYDLPTNALSMAVNARFRNNRVTRSPVFRKVLSLGTSDPRYVTASLLASGLDLLFVGYLDGTVSKITAGGETRYAPAGYTPANADATWSSCHLADLFYINREDRSPWVLLPGDSTFSVLPNWPASTTCKLLKSYAGTLVALDVTESGINFPTLIRTASFAQAETVPASWDYTDPSTNATRNILAEIEGPIIDANVLGPVLIIYGYEQTWAMQADGSAAIFNYRQLPFAKGAIAANCSIQIGAMHYVFGSDDIWAHDGVSEQSIADGKVKDFVFQSLNASLAKRCFLEHYPQLKELHFCFPSGDAFTGFPAGPDGCNRAAIYCYATQTWTFDDRPYVFSGTRANVDSSATWATVPGTWETAGGTWQDQDGSFKRTLVYVGDVNVTSGLGLSLYAFDPFGFGSQVVYPVDTNATKGMVIYRDGLDLDELDEDLQGYKTINYIIPQGRLDPDATALMEFSFGAADGFNDTPIFTAPMSYNGDDLYKIDVNQAGRYLSFKMTWDDYHYVSLSGFDMDYQITGER